MNSTEQEIIVLWVSWVDRSTFVNFFSKYASSHQIYIYYSKHALLVSNSFVGRRVSVLQISCSEADLGLRYTNRKHAWIDKSDCIVFSRRYQDLADIFRPEKTPNHGSLVQVIVGLKITESLMSWYFKFKNTRKTLNIHGDICIFRKVIGSSYKIKK